MKNLLFLLFSLPLLLNGQTVPPGYLALYSVPFNYTQSMSGKPVFSVGAPLSTGNTGDPYPVVWDVAVGGGFAPVSGTAELTTINSSWRKQGMMRLDVSQVVPDLFWLDSNRTTWRNFGEVIQKYSLAGMNQTLQSDRYINGNNFGLVFYGSPWQVFHTRDFTLRATNSISFVTPNIMNLSAQTGWVPILANPLTGAWEWGAGGGNNIYSSNGTLTENRWVNLSNKSIDFEGSSSADFYIGGTNAIDTFAAHTYITALSAINNFKLTTPGVMAGTRSVGQFLRLRDIENGEGSVEFADLPTGTVGGATNTIYTSDGTTTGARTVTFGLNPLSFIGSSTAGDFKVQTPGDINLQGSVMVGSSGLVPTIRSWRDNIGVYNQDVRASWSIQSIENAANVPPGSANPRLRISHIRGTESAPVNSPANEYLGFIDFESYVAENSNQAVGTRIGTISRSIWNGTSSPGNLFISTTPSGMLSDTAHVSALFTGDGTLLARQRDGSATPTSTPNASAVLELNSTTGGFLPPRGTTTQREAIPSPANGLHFYDTTLQAPFFYNGSAWVQVGTGSGGGGGSTNSSVTTGTGTLSGGIFTITAPTPAYSSASVYPDYFAVDMTPNNDGVGGDQIKVGSGPAKPVKNSNKSGVAAYDIASNSIARVVFSVPNDAFILINPASTLAFDSATLSQNTTNGVTTIAVIGGGGGSSTNIKASQLTFTNGNSFATSPSAIAGGAGVETKLGPLWTLRNGVLFRNYKNIMFELNSWNVTSTISDTANLQQAGTGTVAGLGGLSGHAGIHTLNSLVGTNTTGGTSWRNDMISLDLTNKLYCLARIRLPALAVSGGEAYRFSVGFGDGAAGVLLDTDCIAITYGADGPESGKWMLDVSAATVHANTPATVGGTGITDVAANTWYDLEIEATGSLVEWWINGVQQTSYSGASLPLGANKFGPLIRITSYNGGGAATKVAHIDGWNSWGVYSF